ncbi:MAG TPA: cupredoxin domain-containing protein [Acidimicrobiia bacterium]|nr:cupredoxin domain-containing protein [Acidimicrobiia bacterium]
MKRLSLTALVLIAACQGAPASSADVALEEYSIDVSAPTLAAGTVELEVSNRGEFPHTLVVTDASGEVVSAGEIVPPSGTVSVKLDLAAGHYRFTCRIVSQDDSGNLVDHFEEGMVADVSVDT